MVYDQHVALASTSYGNDFANEIAGARTAYNRYGRLLLPWLKWRPEKTVADLWEERRRRREDPRYMAAIRKLQQELDADAAEISAAVAEELEIRRRAVEYRRKREEAAKKPLGRRYVGVPRRRRGLV